MFYTEIKRALAKHLVFKLNDIKGNKWVSYLKKNLRVAKLFKQKLSVNLILDNEISVSIPYTWLTDGSIKTSIFGRGETIEEACADFLSKLIGDVLYDPPPNEGYRIKKTIINIW